MLTGTVTKVRGGWMSVCDAVAAVGQGKTPSAAAAMLADAVVTVVDKDGFDATATEMGWIDRSTMSVFIDTNMPRVLAAYMLLVQRELAGLTLTQVAKKLGAASVNAYAAYEQGKREPSISKLRELLAAVNPELVLAVAPLHANGHAKTRAIRR